jgi:hypothetical protein
MRSAASNSFYGNDDESKGVCVWRTELRGFRRAKRREHSLFTEAFGRGLLGTSPVKCSANFASTAFSEVREGIVIAPRSLHF